MARAERLELENPDWIAFVAGHPRALPFHHPRWAAVIAETYRMPASAVVTRDHAGEIVGGAPVIEVRMPLRKPRLVCLPFTDYCPPLLRSEADGAALLEALESARAESGASRVDMRAGFPGAVPTALAGFRHVLDLGPGFEAVRARFHPSQVRRNIRRAHASGLEIRVSSPGDDLVEAFYRLHLRTRRRLGVPVQPRRFFASIRRRMLGPDTGWIVAAFASGRPAAAALFLASAETVVYKYGASDHDAWSLRPNHLIFEHAIRAACDRSARWFDFGRTDPDAEGLRAFKLSWGSDELPLVYSGIGRVEPVVEGASPMSAGLPTRALAGVIRHAPEWVCRATGEVLYRFAA